MTPSQKSTLKKIKDSIPVFFYCNLDHPEKFEIKRWDVDELSNGHVCLIFEIGKAEEETIDKFFGRDKRQLFIGSHGGVTCYVLDKKKRGNMKLIHGLVKCMSEGE